jgi:hypothetical protein
MRELATPCPCQHHILTFFMLEQFGMRFIYGLACDVSRPALVLRI